MSLIILAFWSCWWDFLSFIEMQFQYTSTKPKRFKTDAHISSLRDIRKSKIDWPYTIWLDKQFFRNFDYLIFIWGFEVYLFETPLYSNHTCLLDILQCWQKKNKNCHSCEPLTFVTWSGTICQGFNLGCLWVHYWIQNKWMTSMVKLSLVWPFVRLP